MSNPVQVDSEVSFRSNPDQQAAGLRADGESLPDQGMHQFMSEVTQALKDVTRELQVLRNHSRYSVGSDQPHDSNRNNSTDQDQPRPDNRLRSSHSQDGADNFNRPRRSRVEDLGNGEDEDQTAYASADYDQNRNNVSPYLPDRNRPRRHGSKFHRFASVKLPTFDGKEDWSTWITRFEVIANRYQWSEEERLDQLLPKLEGTAAQFAFTQLTPDILNDYGELLHEMNCRFRVIETPRSFAAKFSRRSQKPNESVEDFAADLKKLYDKAHGYRDRRTRDEDLVRRFLDGLHDDQVRFKVEYHKDPRNIDEAVYHAVCMMQCRNAGKQSKRNNFEARRAVNESSEGDPEYLTTSKSAETQSEPSNAEVLQSIKQLTKRIQNLEDRGSSRQSSGAARKTKECFYCHEEGHFIKDCPKKKRANARLTVNKSDNQNQPLNYQGPTLAAKGRSQ